jgi:hypothetical protein
MPYGTNLSDFPVVIGYRHWDKDVRVSDQGRLTKVMLVLIGAMTAGALILLGLEGKPIKPMPFSLATQRQLTSVNTAMGTDVGIEPGRWQQIDVIYRTSQQQINLENGLAGDWATAYHFIIANQSSGKNGQIYASDRWAKQLNCLHPTHGPFNSQTIRICLISQDSSQKISSNLQAQQLQKLIENLVKNCQIEANNVIQR